MKNAIQALLLPCLLVCASASAESAVGANERTAFRAGLVSAAGIPEVPNSGQLGAANVTAYAGVTAICPAAAAAAAGGEVASAACLANPAVCADVGVGVAAGVGRGVGGSNSLPPDLSAQTGPGKFVQGVVQGIASYFSN